MLKKMLVMVMAIMLIAGCSSNGSNGSKGETPEQAVTNALEAIKKLDLEKAKLYFADEANGFGELDGSSELIDSKELALRFVEQLDYKILDSTTDGDKATVKVELTNLDMKNVMGEFLQQVMTLAFSAAMGEGELDEEEMAKKSEEILSELLSRNDLATVTNTVEVALDKNGDSWKLNVDDSWQDALLGGMLSSFSGLGELGQSAE